MAKNKSDAPNTQIRIYCWFQIKASEFSKCRALSFHWKIQVLWVINKQCKNILAKSINIK